VNESSGKVTILGGGIGGLTLANALLREGIDFDLYEQAPELGEVGAGIGLSRGALELLDMLGPGEEVRARGRAIRTLYLADRNLRIRRRFPPSYQGFCIHRAELIEILSRPLPRDRIHLSKRVSEVRPEPDGTTIRFSDGSAIDSDCTVAADGINSVARRMAFPGIGIRWIGQTIWRGISRAPVPEFLADAYLEIWDDGLRFLAVPIREGETFWLAVRRAPPGGRDDPARVREELLALFGGFHPALREMIRRSENFLRDDMGDLGPPGSRPWHRHRLAFLGDAIHATTPNLAQGGCQAIEDAVCLARCLRAHGSELETAFSRYRALRQRKVEFVVNTSWRFGVAAHSRNPLLHHGFRLVLERSPAWLLERQERFLSDVGYLRDFPRTAPPPPAR